MAWWSMATASSTPPRPRKPEARNGGRAGADCAVRSRLQVDRGTARPVTLTGPSPLKHGDTLQAGQTRFQFLFSPPDKETTHKAASVPSPELSTVMATSAPTGDVINSTPFQLAGVMLIGREQGQVQIHLPHPQVSRRHARIAMEGTTATLTDLESANGTYVNGQRIRDTASLKPGDQLDIGPYALQFTGMSLIPRPRSDNVELVARGIKRVVKNRETGLPLQLLDDITLVIRPKEFVCLLGPSGSGKSTLLSTLSGRAGTDAGAVLLNGKDLHANFEALKQDIAVVPQKDILHDSLTVGRRFGTRLSCACRRTRVPRRSRSHWTKCWKQSGSRQARHCHPSPQRRTGQACEPCQRDPVQTQPVVS